jgi:PAP2 superfamily
VRRTPALAALTCAALLAVPAVSHAAPSPVVEWNRFLLGVQATAGAQPATVQPTYELALVHAAIYDAVVAIDRSAAPYLPPVVASHRASRDAAADAAAHDTLAALYPAQRAAIDQQYATALALVPGGRAKADGVRAGQRAAAQILRARADDGATAAPPPFTPGSGPGDYQPTPPAFAQPVFTHWPRVKTFTLRSASQFRPPAPPAVTSPKYLAALDEVQALGSAQGSTRTPDQTQIGLFWNPPIWATWNRIAQTAALSHPGGGVSADARTFAALDLALADSVIAFYDAKYAYHAWRPITALRALRDPAWTPLSNTAPDPAYPGAHGTVSGAAADVLASLYGNDFAFSVDSPALPGVLRSFTSFSEAAEEASVSRIYNGNHTRIDQVAGENLGHDVAGWVLGHALRARR